MVNVLSVGEAMIELSEAAPLWAMNVAGDTLNTAWHLRRLSGPDTEIAYLTRLGCDPFSNRIADFITGAGIRGDFLGRDPLRGPGLYAISLSQGERSFTYWRGQSAARHLADDPALLATAFDWADQIYLSGISLAILAPEARARLIGALHAARQTGVRIIFDPNIRPRLWEDAATLRETTMAAAAVADLILPSFEDEAAQFGDTDLSACARRYGGQKGREVVVKNGGGDMLVASGGAEFSFELTKVEPVDTTGAGDAFNAGWIFARNKGLDLAETIAVAHGLASEVIGRKGALG